MEEEHLWLLRESNRLEGAGALLASLTFHGLLLLVLTSTSTYLPVTGSAASFDILWLSASALPTGASKGPPPSTASGQDPVQGDDESQPPADEPETAESPPASAAAAEGEPQATTNVELKQALKETAREQATQSRHQAASEKPVTDNAPGFPAPAPKAPLTARAKMQPPVAAPPAKPAELAARAEAQAPMAKAQPPVSAPPAKPAELTARAKMQPPVSAPPAKPAELAARAKAQPPVSAPPAKPAELAARAEAQPPILADPVRPAESSKNVTVSQRPHDEARSTGKTEESKLHQPSQTPTEPKGLVLPAVHGDLALIVVGSADVKLTFLFRPYPKSRRNRGLTRAEARRASKVAPIVVKTKEQERQAVIERAAEGIYILIAETAEGHPAEANFTLELFGSTANRRIKPLGSRSVSGRAIIAKVLMPEGLLWEDRSAFTGSMVDSDSTTKFNATTGLIWKEYED